MKFLSKKTSFRCAGLATLLSLTVTASLSAAITTSAIYDGTGPINGAANWSGGILPGKSPNGGLVSSTDSLSSSWTGNTWSNFDIRHTGGFLFDAENLGLYLAQGAVYELETDNDYSNVDLEISGDLKLWSNTGTSSEIRIVSGRVEANTLSLTNAALNSPNLINMTNGALNVSALANNVFGKINFSATGSGTISIGNMAGFQIGSLLVNFETGSQGSLYFGDNNGSNTIGSVNFLVVNGKVSIGGVPVTDPTAYNIIQNGTATTLSIVPEPSTYALLAGMATLGLVLYRRRIRQG